MDWNLRVRAAFEESNHVPDADVVEELAQHARAMYEAARADGQSHTEADRLIAAQLEEWRRDAAILRHKRRRAVAVQPPPAAASSRAITLMQDVRYALRLLWRQPRFAALVVLTMGIGIGATTVLFSVVYGVLLKPLPWPDGDRVVVLKETRGGRSPRFMSFTNAAYLAWREELSSVEELGAWSQRMVTLGSTDAPERIRVTAATASLFRVLGARPLIGTLFQEKDETQPVVVLSEGLWRQQFGADPGVLGRTVRFDGEAYSVIGVLPGRHAYPDAQARAFVPFPVKPATGNYLSMFDAIAKLRPGATAARAAAEGTARGRFVPSTGMTTMAVFGGDGPVEIAATPLRDALTREVRRPLLVLLVAAGLLLIVATTNIASLQLARATARRRELAIRAALGAGRARVTRQLLVESLVVGALGSAAAFLLAWSVERALPRVLPADFPRANDIGIDGAVALFTVGIALAASIAVGLLPALRVRRLNLLESLAEDGGSPVGFGSRSSIARARLLIVAGQVAMACVLLVTALLLGRTFVELLHADRGFDPSRVLGARLSMPSGLYTPTRRHELVTRILDRLASVPAVAGAAFTSELPLTPGGSTSAFPLRSPHADGGTVQVQASPRMVSPHYFSTLGLRLVSGRGFEDSDTDTTPPVAVVNETFARRYLGDAPIGTRIPMLLWGQDEQPDATIVGVVEDVRYVTATSTVLPEMYFSYRQMKGQLPVATATLLLRAGVDAQTAASLMRSAVREADESLVAEAVMTLQDRLLTTSLARPRLYAILLAGFAAVALLVTGVGLFAVLSYTVAQRTRELGVRAALGASRGDLVRLVVRQGLAVTVAGLAAGMLLALWVTRFVATLLYGVAPHDVATYVAVPVTLLIVAAVACIAPARRAAVLDPLRALRS